MKVSPGEKLTRFILMVAISPLSLTESNLMHFCLIKRVLMYLCFAFQDSMTVKNSQKTRYGKLGGKMSKQKIDL